MVPLRLINITSDSNQVSFDKPVNEFLYKDMVLVSTCNIKGTKLLLFFIFLLFYKREEL